MLPFGITVYEIQSEGYNWKQHWYEDRLAKYGHVISDGPDSAVGMFCKTCHVSWPCHVELKKRDQAALHLWVEQNSSLRGDEASNLATAIQNLVNQ